MKSILQPLLLLTLGGLAALGGCHSSDSMKKSDVHFDCTCGEPETAFEGCLHPACASGEGNADNPDCVCGTLSLEKE